MTDPLTLECGLSPRVDLDDASAGVDVALAGCAHAGGSHQRCEALSDAAGPFAGLRPALPVRRRLFADERGQRRPLV